MSRHADDPVQDIDELWRSEYATLPDAGLWDKATLATWTSTPTGGVTAHDWHLLHPEESRWSDWHLDAVPLAKTLPPFAEIDTSGDGKVDRAEFGAWVNTMVAPLPAALLAHLIQQHRVEVGGWVRWIGDGSAPWETPAVKVLGLGRDLQGQVLALVNVPGRVGPAVVWNSFGPRYRGQKVKMRDIEASNLTLTLTLIPILVGR